MIDFKPENHVERLLIASSLIFDINFSGSLEIIMRNYQYRRFFSTILRKNNQDASFCDSIEMAFDRTILEKVYGKAGMPS